MSVQANPSSANILELPSTWLAHLVQHVASGAGGLANAAALSQTCKSFHALSDSSAVTYRNLRLDKPLPNLGHPFFRWLARRRNRVAGLTAEIRLLTVGGFEPKFEQLQVMFGIPSLHLTLRCNGSISHPDDTFMTKVIRPHGHRIARLISAVSINRDGPRLQDFCEAAAPCRSLDLTVSSFTAEPLNLGALSSVACSLVRLKVKRTMPFVLYEVESTSSLSLLSHLTSLSMEDADFGAAEPCIHLAGLTNLKQLSFWVATSGDPSSLSALTGLSSLELCSYEPAVQDAPVQGDLPSSCTFSSLQPLSTLQQLVQLELVDQACSATSLHGLAELSKLQAVSLDAPMLRSLIGISTGLTSLAIDSALQLDSLAGIEHLQGLQGLSMCSSGVTSLHPLAALGSLEDLCIGGRFTSLSGLEGNLGSCLRSLRLESCRQLRQLSGMEALTALQQLEIYECEMTSLQPIGQLLGGLRKLCVSRCSMVQEEVLELRYIQPTADVRIVFSNVREVVLAGGVRMRVGAVMKNVDLEDEEGEGGQ